MTTAYEKIRFAYKNEEFESMLKEIYRGKTLADVDQIVDRQMFATYFEGLGMLVKRGLIDIDLVEDLFSHRVIWWWETHAAPYVDTMRQNLKDPTIADSVEYLYNVMKQRAQQAIITT
jgi:hypothetical protein